jgi:hypothetical protein
MHRKVQSDGTFPFATNFRECPLRNSLKSPVSANTKALGAPEAGQTGPIWLLNASESTVEAPLSDFLDSFYANF